MSIGGVCHSAKSFPRTRGKCRGASRDERGAARSCHAVLLFPLSLAYGSPAPPQAVAPFGCGINTAYSAVPPRGAIVSMGLWGVQGGLRGEIEIFPGPPAKRNYKEAYSAFCLFYSLRPLVPLAATSLDREAFGCFTNSHIKPALKREVGFALAKAGGVTSGLLLFVSTPQSIAKPSPGWNKVALLTAVRNSPCSCPFSVSLHPPLAALNSEPRPVSLLVRFINFLQKQGDASRPLNFTISHAHPPSGGFHIAQAIFHYASAQFHPA